MINDSAATLEMRVRFWRISFSHFVFFFSSRRRHTRSDRDWSSDVCSSDLDAGQTVTLMGWAHRRRDHGGLIFVDLRDRTGLTQCVFNPGGSTDAHARAETIRSEFVLAVRGVVGRRPAGTENPKLATGEIEVQVSDIRILNEARPLPFPTEDDAEVDELTRLTYRNLGLRRPARAPNFALRAARY